MADLEIELKTLITKTEYQQIQNHFEFKEPFSQTNYYFDTPDQQLYQQHCGLRLRIFTDHAEQTLKIPTQKKTPINHQLLEISDRLTLDFAQHKTLLTTGQVADALAKRQINMNQLQIFATATTLRRIAKLAVGDLILDQTTYPNGSCDYELELETTTPQAAQSFFTDLLQQFQITASPVTNKVARAVQNFH